MEREELLVEQLQEEIRSAETDLNNLRGTNETFVALLGYNTWPWSRFYKMNDISEEKDTMYLESILEQLRSAIEEHSEDN